ncbi:HNH endonuclease [Priestia abyssalis]|uniref:HNH endonuclease n=1 Tax=Priestia abyssalis TaxID=1221450 RepID=UPI000994C8A8|nr:AP2 domain-containing protein [Priestia abyssalis]
MKNEYEIRGDVTAIFVRNKGVTHEALISTHRLQKAKEFPNTWYASWCPLRKAFYVAGHLPRNGGEMKNTSLHRWILGVKDKSIEVDHYDLDPLNNTDENLREVTKAQNLQNRSLQSNNTSGYRGVCFHKKLKKWQANLRINGKYTYLGVYETKEEAAEVVKEARKKYMPFSKEAMGV